MLADVVMERSQLLYEITGLDPIQFMTAPGLTLQALLKQTGLLINTPKTKREINMLDMYCCGGLSSRLGVSNMEANNKYLEKHNPAQHRTTTVP